jgi:hypothetical protein
MGYPKALTNLDASEMTAPNSGAYFCVIKVSQLHRHISGKWQTIAQLVAFLRIGGIIDICSFKLKTSIQYRSRRVVKLRTKSATARVCGLGSAADPDSRWSAQYWLAYMSVGVTD